MQMSELPELLQLSELPELLLIHIFKFFIDRLDICKTSMYYNGRKALQSPYHHVLNYQSVSNQFNNIVNMTTRDDAYIGLCQYMYLNTSIPNTSFTVASNPFEDYDEGDLVVFDISPYDDSWSSSHSNLNKDPNLCKREDVESIVKILTLNEKYALGKIRLTCGYLEYWLPSVIELLSVIIEKNPEVSINTKIIEIGSCGSIWDEPNNGFWQSKSWNGDIEGNDWDEVETGKTCVHAVTTFVNLVKQLSRNKCNFANGLSCIECSAINLYHEIPFTADMNKESKCHYCETPILPNFKCNGCCNHCLCGRNRGRNCCKGFCCNDCKVSKQINCRTWRWPNCTDEDEDEED